MSVPWVVVLMIMFGWGFAFGILVTYKVINWALKSEAESRA